MADPMVADLQEEPGPEFEPLAIPPLDEQFLASDSAMGLGDFLADPELGFDLGLEYDDNWGCEFTFDDIGDLDVRCEADGYLIPEVFENDSQSPIGADPVPKSASPDSESSTVSVIGGYDVAGFLNSPAESNNPGGNSNLLSPDSGNCDQEFSGGPASSIGSGNCGSGVSEGESSPAAVVEKKKVKPEAIGSKKETSVPKRKKEADEEGNSESRTPKFRRSEISPESPAMDDDDEKKKARLMRNRESAQLSRQRKKHYVEELEDKVRIMNSTIADLNNRISYVMAENAGLRQQMSGGGGVAGPPQPPSGMYPHPAMPYPWVPCPPYMMKPQGHVPLVPIPRLKPQHTAKASKKSEGRKSGESGRTKKVASISFLGLLFFVLLFGGLVPMMNVNFGGFNDNSPSGFGFPSGRLYDQHWGRVLTVDDGLSRSGESIGVRHNCKEKGSHQKSQCSGESGGGGVGNNISEPLMASLYVPRNDKMVKIDGNLIIHSVLASEKTKASLASLELKRNTETRLAIARNIPPSYAVPEAGANPARRVPSYSAERQKALSSGTSEAVNSRLKSSPVDGRLQQWFREGLEGPMLSSGMCTEVFQFDVSPASNPGAIVTSSSVANVSSKQAQNITQNNSTRVGERRNRRTLHRVPVPLSEPNYNITKDEQAKNHRGPQKDDFKGNRSVSSPMVVSVLVDPREASDPDIDGVLKPKSLSRIFVVVLMDSVKYVTYSCVLPRPAPHLVTA